MSTTTDDTLIPSEMADGEAHPTIVPAAPELEVDELPLEGQPATDKAFRAADGLTFRARIVTIAQQATQAPANGAPTIAPAGINLSLTLALLDANMDVAKDANGALLITDLHEIVWGDAAMRNDAFDPAASLMTEIRQQAFILKTRMEKRSAVADALAAWGGAPMKEIGKAAEAAVEEISPAVTSKSVADMIQDAADEATQAQIAIATADAEAKGRADGAAEERARIEAEAAEAANAEAATTPADDTETTTS